MNRKTVLIFFSIVFLVAGPSAHGKDNGPWKDLVVEVGDIKMHYLDAGTGDRVLVFIPGWTMTAEVWKEQIPYFSSRGFRVIALDPRSQGLTTKTESGNTYQQHAADLHAFLQALKIDHSYLIGWGSGVLALLDYISSPEALKPEKMVFVDGSPAALKSEDYPGTMTVQQARRFALSLEENRAKATEQFIRSLFKQHQAETLINEMTAASVKMPLSATLSLYFDLFTGDRRPALMHVPVPSLVMTNPEGRLVGEYMKSKIPRCSLEVIEGAGSAMFLEKPQTFNQILENFLGEH
ncbi:MAG: alpha/beta hydrolase [Geobacteraceae bacterium]|jgi:microsomal epoxide hydrolase